jgi:succinyl-CoA synthetase alpha subunit
VNAPQFHGKARAITASSVLEAVGSDLASIRQDDKMTWVDIGEVLGKSEDQAAKYADGSAEMGVVAYAKGRKAWGGRFTGSLDRLIGTAAPHIDGNEAQHCILKCALTIEETRDSHGNLTIEDIRNNRSTLENARDAIDAQLSRLGPKGKLA